VPLSWNYLTTNAPSGAAKTRKARCQVANGGSLFLDEIGEMAPLFQAELLWANQHREFRKVGGKDPIRVDV
jgi:Nif-specific regulatory protein